MMIGEFVRTVRVERRAPIQLAAASPPQARSLLDDVVAATPQEQQSRSLLDDVVAATEISRVGIAALLPEEESRATRVIISVVEEARR
jgi:hypothetical protein